MVNAHLTRGFWLHVGPGALGVLTEPIVLALTGVVVVLAAALTLALKQAASRAQRRAASAPNDALAGALSGALVGAMLLALLGATAISWRQAPHPQHWALIPEINAAQTLWQFNHRAGGAAVLRTPDGATLARLRAAGLIPQQTIAADYPLQRSRLGGYGPSTQKSDSAATMPKGVTEVARGLEVAPQAKGPPLNVLVVLVESLSAGLVGHHTPRWSGLTPHLDQLSTRMTVATNYFNSTSPTINGWLATLCSIVPSAWSLDVDAGESVDGGGAAFTCLSDLLVRRGYRAEHVQGASRTYTATEAILRGHGYHHVVGREDLRRLHPASPENKWGKYDDVTVGHAIGRLKRLASSQTPWMLSVATIDLHTPGYPRPGCKPPTRFAGDPVLTAAWCSDEALSALWQTMDSLDLWQNTVVVISADHPIFPFPAIQELFADKARQYGVFAQLPLLIHDPRGALPKRLTGLMSQLDVAPTLAEVLDLTDEPNSFQGRSALSPPPSQPLVVGRMGSHTVHLRTQYGGQTLPFGVLLDRCHRKKPAIEQPELLPSRGAADRSLSDLRACDLVRLFRWQDDLWARHELMPRRKRDVKTQLRLDKLRQQWLQEDLSERRSKANAAPVKP